MEKKEQGLKHWFLSLIGQAPAPQVYGPDNPRVVRVGANILETFPYDGYDVEIRHEAEGFYLSVHLKGDCCLVGWFFSPQDWALTVPTTANHIVSYRTREYIKSYALERINKE